MDTIRIGCSGWNYKHWRGRFYPEKMPVREWFQFYAENFDTVEINNTFYRLPEAKTVQNWEAQAPDDFRYAVKANRYITHMIKLKNAEEPLQRFLDVAILLKDHLGPILIQLPPSFRYQRERLESFLDLLPKQLLFVFEFRNQSWMTDEVFQILETNKVSFCTHDMRDLDVPRLSVGPAAYVRLHGAGSKYSGSYPDEILRTWWDWMQLQITNHKQLYVYFNNDVDAHAIHNAKRLKEIAGIV